MNFAFSEMFFPHWKNIFSHFFLTATDVLSGDVNLLQKLREMSHGDTLKLHVFSSLYVFPKCTLLATTGKRIWYG